MRFIARVLPAPTPPDQSSPTLAALTLARRSLALVTLALVTLASASSMAGPILPAVPVADPMPAIVQSGIRLNLVPFVTVPNGNPQLIQPVGDGSGRLAINENGGRIYMTTQAGGSLSAPYLNVATAVTGFNPDMMGLAFHPDFATNGKFYTAYHATTGSGIAPIPSSTPGVNEIVIREWTASSPGAATFIGSSREVIRVSMPSQGHTVGMIAFNPNATSPSNPDYGKLYVAIGDAGDNRSYAENGQNLAVPYGKVLRLDPTPNGAEGFTVPSDNPFVGQPGKEPLVWAYGLRNPQYLSWQHDGAGTMMFINDIGEGYLEEVNTGVAGGNYGWSTREGTFATFRDPTLGVGYTDLIFQLGTGPDAGLLYPVAQYDHDEGNAIGAGLLYQGSAIPALVGKYIASDIVNGRLFVTDVTGLVSDNDPAGVVGFEELQLLYEGTPRSLLDVLGSQRADARIGVDDNGELYLLTKYTGEIFRLTAASENAVPAPPPLPILLIGLGWLLALRRRAQGRARSHPSRGAVSIRRYRSNWR